MDIPWLQLICVVFLATASIVSFRSLVLWRVLLGAILAIAAISVAFAGARHYLASPKAITIDMNFQDNEVMESMIQESKKL